MSTKRVLAQRTSQRSLRSSSLPSPTTTSTATQRRLHSRVATADQSIREELHASDTQLSRPSRQLWQPQLSWGTVVIGTIGFTTTAVDVFDAHSAHLLLHLDTWGHAAAQSIDPALRSWLWGSAVSDLFITGGLLGWTAVTLHVAFNSRQEAAAPAAVVGLSWLFYGFLAGRVEGDAWLVGTLKELFHRARPSDIHRSMSFPSGHTTAATFLAATLLFVFIPVLLHKLDPDSSSKPSSLLKQLEAASWPLFGTAWVTTAVGRVLADAHWASDTVAAGFLGLAVTAVLAKASEVILAADSGDDNKGAVE